MLGHDRRVVVENDVAPTRDQVGCDVLEERRHDANSCGPVDLLIFCAGEDEQWPARRSLLEESSGVLCTVQNQGGDVGRKIYGASDP